MNKKEIARLLNKVATVTVSIPLNKENPESSYEVYFVESNACSLIETELDELFDVGNERITTFLNKLLDLSILEFEYAEYTDEVALIDSDYFKPLLFEYEDLIEDLN